MNEISTSDASFQDALIDGCVDIIREARFGTYIEINRELIRRNWMIGRLISEEMSKRKLQSPNNVISEIAQSFDDAYDEEYTEDSLRLYHRFYSLYPAILESLDSETHWLSWGHYVALLRVNDQDARKRYEEKATRLGWSIRDLDRNITYGCLECHPTECYVDLPAYLIHNMEFIRQPSVLRFLGIDRRDYLDLDLPSRIRRAAMESILRMNIGYAFVSEDLTVGKAGEGRHLDLAFFNIRLKAFVVIRFIQGGKVDLDQMSDMLDTMKSFDKGRKTRDHGPTLGILISNTGSDYNVTPVFQLNHAKTFYDKYVDYLPDFRVVCSEIEAQKSIYYADHPGEVEGDGSDIESRVT